IVSKALENPSGVSRSEKIDGNFALGNVPSDMHIEASPSTSSDHLLNLGIDKTAPEHGKTLGITHLTQLKLHMPPMRDPLLPAGSSSLK
ncbi:Hypothetical predicted protein, partial [Olea europaea subsp. europaea]